MPSLHLLQVLMIDIEVILSYSKVIHSYLNHYSANFYTSNFRIHTVWLLIYTIWKTFVFSF